MRNRINPFIRAHGATPGPLMRPRLTGWISATLAGISIFLILLASKAIVHLTNQYGWMAVVSGFVVYSTYSGILYGQVYRRAANDIKGGWIFGASTGYILWMINPLIWRPWFGYQALWIGKPALIFMLIHVFHGALMGLLYPWIHFLLSKQSKS